MLLVIGCARSGTQYTAQVLKSLGWDAIHEKGMGEHATVSWECAAESETTPCGLNPYKMRGAARMILHQIRNPLDCIASCTTLSKKTWKWIGWQLRLAPSMPMLERAAWYWIEWNRLCEQWTDHRVRIDAHPPLIELVNARPHDAIAWSDLAPITAGHVKDMARRYGYEVRDD